MDEKTIINIGKTLFWLSFGLGNICLFGYILTKLDYFVMGGIVVLEGGFIVNLTTALILIIYGIFNKPQMKVCFKSILIMLINIPIAVIYAYVGIFTVFSKF